MDLATPEGILGITSLVFALALIAIRLSGRIGMPSLLLYLVIGLVIGALGIDLKNTLLTEHLGFLALVFILAEGGLTSRWENLRPALGLGISLSTIAVMVSIAVVGTGVFLLMGLDWRTALLWGAVLSSTDAAAVFSVLRGIGVKPRLSAALELESGLNDAPVVIAVLVLAGTDPITWLDPLLVVYQLVVGAVVGAVIGVAGGWVMRREALPAAGLYPLTTIALIGGAYAVGVFAHASGFLATYVAAAILGNSHIPHRAATLSFAEGLGWLAQIGLFVMLGLYVDPTRLPAAVVPGLLIGLILLLVARPASVVAAALPFRLPWREQAFLSWSGLRGAVPIVLAMIPLINGVPYSLELMDVIVVVVFTYTLLQGTTLSWVARKLGVIQPGQAMEIQVEAGPLDDMGAHVLQLTIPDKSRMHGVYISQLRLPASATISLLLRDGQPVHLNPDIRLQSGDQLLIVAPDRVRVATERRLRAVGRGGPLAGWFGERGERSDD